jgi:HlyD family secretion protein
LSAKHPTKFVWFLVAAGVVAAVAATAVVILPRLGAQTDTHATPAAQPRLGVAALGRIQPEDGTTIRIGARSLSGQPSLVAELRVREGDNVAAGDIIAILNSRPQLEGAWRQSEARVKVAETRQSQVKAGAKSADIAAQEGEVARLEFQLATARAEHGRMESLHHEGLVTESAWEQSRLTVDTTAQMLAAAKARLRSLSEVRQIDVDVAEAERQAAMADAQRARAEAEAATIRAPYNGRVVKIHAWQGEEVRDKGILELAKVDRMYVIAEVAESDIQRVKVGQRARITGESLAGPLLGTVEQLGLKVSRNSLTLKDPVNLTDARIVEVKIRLDDGHRVTSLIDAQVDVLINP